MATLQQFFHRIWLCLLVVTSLLGNTNVIASSATDARVIYINSYHRGYSWSDGIEDGLRQAFAESGKQIELSVEYLDSRRFTYGGQIGPLAEAMAIKYANYHPDLVIVSDNAAFDFVIQHRAKLFTGLPIVFCGYNNFRPEVLKGLANITGVNEEVAIEDAVTLALGVHPKTRTLAFVTSTGDASSRRIAEIAEQVVFPKLRERFDVVELKDASIKQIHERLATLPAQTILFLSGQASDPGAGRALTPAENGSMITSASPFPAYTFWDFHLGHGAIGGHIITGPEQGRAAASMALQVLAGTPADSIPVLMTTPTRNIFDYKVLDRFGITENALPTESVVINRPPSIWKEHQQAVLSGLLLIILLSAFVVALALSNRRRRYAELQARESEVRLKIANDKLSELNKVLLTTNGELERSRDAAEASNTAKVAFLSNISHEMRTPLHQISGLTQLLKRGALTPQHIDYVDKLTTAVRQMISIVETILKLTQIEANKLELKEVPLAIDQMAGNVVSALQANAEAKHLMLDKETDALSCNLLGDASHIQLALFHYVENAIRFTDAGSVTIRARQIQEDAASVLIRFEVEDTGIGIAPDVLPRLFNIFEQADNSATRKHGGTGAGLALTKKIAQMMGGEAGCTSSLGTGSLFWFTARLRKATVADSK